MRICIAYIQGPDDNSKAGQVIARVPNWAFETPSVSAGNVHANLASSRTLLVFRPTGIELALQEAARALVEKSPSAKRQFARLMRRLFDTGPVSQSEHQTALPEHYALERLHAYNSGPDKVNRNDLADTGGVGDPGYPANVLQFAGIIGSDRGQLPG